MSVCDKGTMNDESSSWCLSPRWRVVAEPRPMLLGPANKEIGLEADQYQALQTGLLSYAPFVASGRVDMMLAWAKNLISMRVLVPESALPGPKESATTEDFFGQAFQSVCHLLEADDLFSLVRQGIASWSGPVLQQPLTAPREFLPGKPAWCQDLWGGAPQCLRLALDCRDPLLTPWENISFAQGVFRHHLHHGRDLFDSICDLVFKDPAWFSSPLVKYLHPAIEYQPGSKTVSAYWNLGMAPVASDRWGVALGVVEALGPRIERLMRFRESFGAIAQPELIGHTFKSTENPMLKVYVMFDGLDRLLLQQMLIMENCESAGRCVLRAFDMVERVGFKNGKNLAIASLYHPLGGGCETGMKIHFNLKDGFFRNFRMEEILAIVADSLGPVPKPIVALPERIILDSGIMCNLVPHTLSFMLSPTLGLSRITLYVNFIPEE